MSGYLSEIEANANNLEHLLRLMFAPGLTADEKNTLCSYIEKAIALNAMENKIDMDGWKKSLKAIVEKYSGPDAEGNPKIKELQKFIGNIQWHEQQLAFSFGEFTKLAKELLS